MRLTKRFRSVGLVLIGLLLASLTLSAQSQKWSSLDWDDDLVPDVEEDAFDVTVEENLKDPYLPSKYDAEKGPLANNRALVLKEAGAVGGIKLPVAERFIPTSEFTVEFWYSPIVKNAGKEILFQFEGNKNNYAVYVEDGVIKANVNELVFGDFAIDYAADAPASASQMDKWTYIALVWKKASTTKYAAKLVVKNTRGGYVANSAEVKALEKDTNFNAYLGKNCDNGFLDEFSFWGKVLDDSILEEDYNGGKGKISYYAEGDKFGLKAYYRFDDGGDSIEDYAYLPDFKVATALDPSKEEDKTALDEIFKYRVLASDNNVKTLSLYKDAAKTQLIKKGNPIWVTNLSCATPEWDLAIKADGVDSDYDGFVDDGQNLADDKYSKNRFAIIRNAADGELMTVPESGLLKGAFIVYDDNGCALWVLRGFEKDMDGIPNVLDANQQAYGNKIVSTEKFADALSKAESNFANGRDDDGDGVVDDTNFAMVNLANPVKPIIQDADDDGILDHDEQVGSDPLCNAKITNAFCSTSPLFNRVLDLTGNGTRYITTNEVLDNIVKSTKGFSLALWYKIDESNTLNDSVKQYPLIYKTNIEATIPGDFWFGFERDDSNKLRLTLKYRMIANSTQAEATARYQLDDVDLLDPAMGWTFVCATVTKDAKNADAMRVNFGVYTTKDGMTYKSDNTQYVGYIGATSGQIDINSANGQGKIVVGSQDSNESLKLFVDEVRIWNTSTGKTDEMLATKDKFLFSDETSNMVCYYRFDDGCNVTGRNTIQDFAADWMGTFSNNTDASMIGNAKLMMLDAAKKGDETFAYLSADRDNDDICDFWEYAMFQNKVSYDGSTSTHNSILAIAGEGDVDKYTDFDEDGLNDYYEYFTGHDPQNDDTNSVTMVDGEYVKDYEYDYDGDGMNLLTEQKYGTNPYVKDEPIIVDDETSDIDDDGINNYDEEHGDVVTGKMDSLSPMVWRALRANGEADNELVVKEIAGDRCLGVNAKSGLSQDWTLEIWFMLTDADKGTGSFIKRVRNDGNIYFDFGLKDRKPYARASMANTWKVDGKNTNLLELYPENGSEIELNTWVHYTAVWNAAQKCLSLYIDGTFTGSVYCVSAPLIDGGKIDDFTTSILGDYDGSYLAGYIDDVRIWVDMIDGMGNTRKGLRLPRQIKEWMSKALPVVTDNSSVDRNNTQNLAAAYYRFDDGGKTIQDFAYSMNNEITSKWMHSPATADAENRMLSSWGKGDDKTGENWYECKASERAVNMNGGGNTDFDPIPDGWQQYYWGENAGGPYDLNQQYLLAGRSGTNLNDPQWFPGEGSYTIDPLTGMTISNAQTHSGGNQAAYLYITDLFFDDISNIKNAVLNYSLSSGLYACNSTSQTNPIQIWIFINGKRVGYSNGSTGAPGEDVATSLSTQANGQAALGGLGYTKSGGSGTSVAGFSDSIDFTSALSKGRNRIAILTNYYHTNTTCTSHIHGYNFTAKVLVDGNKPDNYLGHVKWFYYSQSASGVGLTSISSCRPSQEDTAHCHAKEADGVTNKLYFWFEKFFAVCPWGYDQDPDGDGLTNWTEYLANTNPVSRVNTMIINGKKVLMQDSDRDEDGDGLNNLTEQNIGTFPGTGLFAGYDTDDDGINDYDETNAGYNPLDSASAPDQKNKVAKSTGKYVFTVPEVGDVIGQDELTSWSVEAWIKPDGQNAKSERQILVRRTVGRYMDNVELDSAWAKIVGKNYKNMAILRDVVNYEIGLSEDNYLYAGFSVIKETANGIKIVPVMDQLSKTLGHEPIENDVWTHIAAVYTEMKNNADGSITYGNLRLYVNGVLIHTKDNISDLAPTTYTGVCGLTISGPLPQAEEKDCIANAYIGMIDNLAIWSSTRTASEIKQSYEAGLSSSLKVGTYTFNCEKVATPFMRTNKSLLHAFTFDDGGQTVENYAWQQDWYNNFAHAMAAPTAVDGTKMALDEVIVEDQGRSESDTDTDGDLIPDYWENQYGLDPKDPSDADEDWDGDGLSNLYEYLSGTNPNNPDTNDDGITDDEDDLDGDGLTNFEEYCYGTLPNKWDTDDDGFSDAFEVGYDYWFNGVLMPGKGVDYGVLPTSSISQPNQNENNEVDLEKLEVASSRQMSRVFRLAEYKDISDNIAVNSMVVKDNPVHSDNQMTISFWFRPQVTNGDWDNYDFNNSKELPKKSVTFMRRTVLDEKNYSNYEFSFDGTQITMKVSRKGSTNGFSTSLKPVNGFKAGQWYFITGIIDAYPKTWIVEPSEEEIAAAAAEGREPTPEVVTQKSQKIIQLVCITGNLNADGEFENVVYETSTPKSVSTVSGLNVGDKGEFILGKKDAETWPEGLVIDIDSIKIRDAVMSVAEIKAMFDGSSVDEDDILWIGNQRYEFKGQLGHIMSQFLFDDGGKTAEDFCHPQDWWTSWKHAGVVTPGTDDVYGDVKVGYGMVKDSSLSGFNTDSDHDGLPDDWEIKYLGTLEYGAEDDPDGDGLTNADELIRGTNPNLADTDSDGMPDKWEVDNGLNPLDPKDANDDNDNDGVVNWKEYSYGTDPNNEDTDGDGLPDAWEIKYTNRNKKGEIVDPSLDPLNAEGEYGPDGDPDHDGLTNLEEYIYGTNPIFKEDVTGDTDGDGLADVEERADGTNTDSQLVDTDDDEYDDYTETYVAGTRGYDSMSKPSLELSDGFVYAGNKVAQFTEAHGTLTVPNGIDPDRIGFGSWTVEARFRVLDMDKNSWPTSTERVYLLRRSYTNYAFSDNKPVNDSYAVWNYAIGYEIDPSNQGVIYPFVSYLSEGSVERIAKSSSGVAVQVNSNPDKLFTDWHFISGTFDATKKVMNLYIDGVLDRSKAFVNISLGKDLCAISAERAGKNNTYTKLGEFFKNGRLLIDEVRIWGVKSNTIEASGTSTGYVNNFVRTDAEIALGANRPIRPNAGVYDSGLTSQYNVNEELYALDKQVSDNWTTKPGTVGVRGVVTFHDKNGNGMWDPGEDVWRDRSLAQALRENPELEAMYPELKDTDYTDLNYDYKATPNLDVMLSAGRDGKWEAGVGYTLPGSTTSVTADASAVGTRLEVTFIDKNGNGLVDYGEDMWVDYDNAMDETDWYTARQSGWAVRMGLALYLSFDDGGGSIEDYAWQNDWRSTPKWSHAIRPTELAGVFPPITNNAVPGTDYQYVTSTLNSDSTFAWIIDATQAPTNPEIAITTLANADVNGDDRIDAVIPATGNDINGYDILSAEIRTASSDPEDSKITYWYMWLAGEASDWSGLSYKDGSLINGDEYLPMSCILNNNKELDMYNLVSNNLIGAGDKITLAVLAISESGMSSDIVLTDIDVRAMDNAMVKPVTLVSWSSKNYAAGQNIGVTLRINDPDAGIVVIRWYRNLVLFETVEHQVSAGAAGRTVTYMDIDKQYVKDGDTWSYKAYYVKNASSKSRTTPPDSQVEEDKGANWKFVMVGEGYKEHQSEEENLAPTIPTGISITPEYADPNSLIIAEASGSYDPNGDNFRYFYQWFINGEPVVGENMQYFPALKTGATVIEPEYNEDGTLALNDDGTVKTTSTSLSATTLATGDIVMVKAWATDIYGLESIKMVSRKIEIQTDFSEIYADEQGEAGTLLAYEPNNNFDEATRLWQKADWTNVSDGNVQTHYLQDIYDQDYFVFVVPGYRTGNKSLVKLQATHEEATQMFSNRSRHLYSDDSDLNDLYMELYDSNHKKIAQNDDTILQNGLGTKFPWIEKELEAGVYYARISYAGTNDKFRIDYAYLMHLGISEVSGSDVPMWDGNSTAVLSPFNPLVTENLECKVTGAYTTKAQASNIEYYYIWYRNGNVVPFGNEIQINEYNVEMDILSYAKNFSDSTPNVIEAKYTKAGDIWNCIVFAAYTDENGKTHFSENAIYSNMVYIQGDVSMHWSMNLEVSKTYRSAAASSVSGNDQLIVIGQEEHATYGFDPAFDSAIASYYVPNPDGTYKPLPMGTAYSVGMDNKYERLNKDYRPAVRSSVWYVKVEMGSEAIDTFSLNWSNTALPMTAVNGLTITRMVELADKTWVPYSDEVIDMTQTESVGLSGDDFNTVQKDANGQYFVVYRIMLGAADEPQTIQLQAGWNMVSFAVTPLDNRIEKVFSKDGESLIDSDVWAFADGQYVAAPSIQAGVGYWIHVPEKTSVTVVGSRLQTTVKLNTGWNLVGPIYNVGNIDGKFGNIYKYGSTAKPISYIYRADSAADGSIKYVEVNSMEVGKAYWILCNCPTEMNFEANLDK